MSFTLTRVVLNSDVFLTTASIRKNCKYLLITSRRRKFTTTAIPARQMSAGEERLVVVGGGAAGIYGAIRTKTVAPKLNVVIEKGKPLSKVRISGGGRCNVTNGHCADNKICSTVAMDEDRIIINIPEGGTEESFRLLGDALAEMKDQSKNRKPLIQRVPYYVRRDSATFHKCYI